MRTAVRLFSAGVGLLALLQPFTAARAQTTITAHTFRDDDRNGRQGSDEDDLSNWPVGLFAGPACRSFLTELATDGDGNAVFRVDAGSYSVGERLRPGWECTTARCQEVDIDQDSVTVLFGNYWTEDQQWK